jgi:hypothetical protein
MNLYLFRKTFPLEKSKRNEASRDEEGSSDEEEVERVVEKKQKRPSSPSPAEEKVKLSKSIKE